MANARPSMTIRYKACPRIGTLVHIDPSKPGYLSSTGYVRKVNGDGTVEIQPWETPTSPRTFTHACSTLFRLKQRGRGRYAPKLGRTRRHRPR